MKWLSSLFHKDNRDDELAEWWAGIERNLAHRKAVRKSGGVIVGGYVRTRPP